MIRRSTFGLLATAALGAAAEPLAAQADPTIRDLQVVVAGVAKRPPTAAELAQVRTLLQGQVTANWYRAFARSFTSRDHVARRSAYDVASGIIYCALENGGKLTQHRSLFSADPVLGAACGGGSYWVMRSSGLDAMRAGARFVSALTGAPPYSDAHWRSERMAIPANMRKASFEQAQFFAMTGTNYARTQSIWKVLGTSDAGRRLRSEVAARVKAARGPAEVRLPLFYALTEEAWKKAAAVALRNGTMNRAMARHRMEIEGIGRLGTLQNIPSYPN